MAQKPLPLSRAGAQVHVSFEFFPPKTADMEANLWEAATRLEPLNPAFVSVTYGAGGSTRERTHTLVERMARETTMKPAAHLTCVGSSCGEIRETLRDYHSAGVRHIVALRGDPRHYPILLRQFGLFPLCRRRRSRRARRSDRARDLSGAELQADRQFRPENGGECAAMARGPVRGACGGRRDAPSFCRRPGRRG